MTQLVSKPRTPRRTRILLVLAASLAAIPSIQADPPRPYRVLIIPMDFPDVAGDFLSTTTLQVEFVDRLTSFYDEVSYGQLQLSPTLIGRVSRATCARKYYGIFHPEDPKFEPTVCGSGYVPTFGKGEKPNGVKEIWQDSQPIAGLIAGGFIRQTPEGLAPNGAGPGEVFDAIFFIDTVPIDCLAPGFDCTTPPAIATCKRSSFTAAYTVPNQLVAADTSGKKYFIGYAPATSANGNVCSTEFNDYAVAAHEFGHAISNGRFHPAGYISAYELMDSAYPCSPGIYTRLSTDVVGAGNPVWFPGWIPSAKVTILSPPVGTTEVLAPVEFDPLATASPMGLKVGTSQGYYYLVECRSNTYPDRTGCYQDGVLIDKTYPAGTISTGGQGVDTVIQQMQPPGWGPPPAFGAWRAHYLPGQSYSDTAADVLISVGPTQANGACTVTVNYGGGSTLTLPDVGLAPWLSEPMNTYETTDIWVDSSCNGYAADDPSDPKRLKYGRRTDGTVIGNGDDPCLDHHNRLYARVHNYGTAAATDAVVRFEATQPLGVGIRGADGWASLGSVSKLDFPALASIPPGGSVDVFVDWVPKAKDVPVKWGTFAFHSCVRVKIDAVAGEKLLSNQDGDREQENIDYFNAVLDAVSGVFNPAVGSIFLANPTSLPKNFYVSYTSQLPSGWSVSLGDGTRMYTVEAQSTLTLPVTIVAPPDAAIGLGYHVDVAASVATTPPGDVENGVACVGFYSGLVLEARAVLPSNLSFGAQALPPDTCPPQAIHAYGCLTPAEAGLLVTIDYTGPSGAVVSRLAATDPAGCFDDLLSFPAVGDWRVQAIWQGDLMHAEALSTVEAVPAYDPSDVDCDQWPNAIDNCPRVMNPQQEDLDQDGHGDACDCNPQDPGAFAGPLEISGLLFSPDRVTLFWDPAQPLAGPGTVHDVLRGPLDQLPVGSGAAETCLASGTPGAAVQDPETPEAEHAFWYLVRAKNSCGVGTLGRATGGERQSQACP